MSFPTEKQLRIDLAATFRIIAHLGMHQCVANHFSASVSPDGKKFLINPKWKHFSRVCASDLILLDADDPTNAEHPEVDSTAWAIHGQLHKQFPHIKVALHLHPIYTTAISVLKDPQILPIDQNTARYFNRVSFDSEFGGMANSAEEGARIGSLLKNNSRLLMGNHGVMVTSSEIGIAFDDIWTLERSCQILVTALSTGKPLNILSDEVAEKTAQDWERIPEFSRKHFEEMKELMIQLDPSFLD